MIISFILVTLMRDEGVIDKVKAFPNSSEQVQMKY